MISVLSLLLILVLSVIVTRVSTIALVHTGLSRETAKFQARSAFTGAGFTTSESERIVTHPVRRRIVMLLMMIGNAGLVTAVASLMLTFVGTESALGAGLRISMLVGGVALLFAFTMSEWVEQRLSRIIEWSLRRFTDLVVCDYAALMHVADDYRIAELKVAEGDWIAGSTLRESGLREEGLVVLGIESPGGKYLGTPQPETRVKPDDRLLIYGRAGSLEALDRRSGDREGDREHRQAVESHSDSADMQRAVQRN